MSREAIDALEAWHATTRALRKASPNTSEWVRLRMIAQEQRVTYESLIEDRGSAAHESTTHEETREQRPERQRR
jgi:hypothetical protein